MCDQDNIIGSDLDGLEVINSPMIKSVKLNPIQTSFQGSTYIDNTSLSIPKNNSFPIPSFDNVISNLKKSYYNQSLFSKTAQKNDYFR